MPDKKKRPNRMASRAEVLYNIINNLDAAVYVSDIETNEILFANMRLRKMYGNALLGKICWASLRQKTKRCEFCPIPYLLKNPGKSYLWEMNDGDKRFLVYDSIIPWKKGKVAHLQHLTDITKE